MIPILCLIAHTSISSAWLLENPVRIVPMPLVGMEMPPLPLPLPFDGPAFALPVASISLVVSSEIDLGSLSSSSSSSMSGTSISDVGAGSQPLMRLLHLQNLLLLRQRLFTLRAGNWVMSVNMGTYSTVSSLSLRYLTTALKVPYSLINIKADLGPTPLMQVVAVQYDTDVDELEK